MPSQNARLASFKVDQLFFEFSPNIPLNLDEHITAVIAPNGSGKTVCLRLINALFRRQWSQFASVAFQRIEYRFTSGETLEVWKEKRAEPDQSPQSSLSNFKIVLTPVHGAPIEWTPEPIDVQRSRGAIDRHLSPFLTRIGPNHWQHDYTGQVMTIQEVVETYSDQLPVEIRGVLINEPEPIQALIGQIDCHLIETQRLLVLPGEEVIGQGILGRSDRRATTLAISKKAQTLKTIMARDFQAYATLSQSLDRSFPRRAIQKFDFTPINDLRNSLQENDQKRRELMDAGILDTEASDPVSLPEGDIEQSVVRVLSVYAADTKQKLDSLSTLLTRVQLFKSLIEQRFTGKQIEIDKEAGFKVKYHGRNIPLEKLSSGEQHQLVLFFELLFELRANALILIDEPELSLHVAWQKKFIPDLKKIIELNKFDVVLATHSPQLIGRWSNLTVELGDVDSE